MVADLEQMLAAAQEEARVRAEAEIASAAALTELRATAAELEGKLEAAHEVRRGVIILVRQ